MTTAVTGANGDAVDRLPAPDRAFHWTTETWGYALRCTPLSAVAQHLFSTKQLRLRGSAPQSDEWRLVMTAMSVGPNRLLRVKQVHGSSVRVVRKNASPNVTTSTPEADAIASDASGFALAVQVADCVPILIFDRKIGIAAAVHAGWRGTRAGVARSAVESVGREFGTHPDHLMCAIGPSIGPCCYEVGPEVLRDFQSAGFAADEVNRWFGQSTSDSIRLDLWTANRDQLIAAGAPADHIYICGLCTKTHHELFASYRADGEQAGRMAAVITVP